jgi:GntR family transcriptional regulator, transcriptional repressor for pyruvate dehydrogenase complex
MFEKITPTLRSRLVVEQIISWLKNRDVSVGDKLAPERELAVAMNVSRNTLREAIAILQLAGILEVKQGSGIFVASIPSEAEVDSWMSGIGPQGQIDPETAIDARIALEPGIAILASKVSEATDWEKFENCIQEMEGARRAGDIDRYRRNDNHLHRAIALATHNQFIAATILPLLDTAQQPVWYTIKNNVYTAELMNQSFQEHVDIISAMKNGDSIEIFTVVTRHLQRSKDRLTIDVESVRAAEFGSVNGMNAPPRRHRNTPT